MNAKLLSLTKLIPIINDCRSKGETIVFTNGCFDIFHAGHARYLNEARHLGDILIIGLNSDKSVTSIKGSNRPIISQEERAEVLAALACVNFIVLFDDPDPFWLIAAIKPDILVKGADWEENNIVGANLVKSLGGKTTLIKLLPNISTSDIIQRIISRYCQ